MRVITTFFFLLSFLMGNGYRDYGSKAIVKVDRSLYVEYRKQLERLTPVQRERLQYIYARCARYDLSKTCAAIAWEESMFGVYKVIPDTGDYGVMGINLKWYMIDNGYNRHNRYLKSRLATKLACNDDYSIMYAIAKLEKLKSKYKTWKEVWAHYNGGTRPNWRYAKRILNKIIALRYYLKDN